MSMVKEMATHSSILAWRISGTEEAGGLLSMGSHSVGHECYDLAAAAEMSKKLGSRWQSMSKQKLVWNIDLMSKKNNHIILVRNKYFITLKSKVMDETGADYTE